MKRCSNVLEISDIFKPSEVLPKPMASISTLFLSNPHRPRRPTPRGPIPLTPFSLRTLYFSTKAASTEPPPPGPPEKKSFAVATGELFLGIAARLIIRREGGENNNGLAPGVTIFPENDQTESWWRRRRKERIASVVEDPVQPDVVWEQREEDVEAERRRKAVTSPGFSFSAAGLLFPYHLGVAQFLIEKGYIKDTTPLAGSSAGAIVCAVIASGASMQDALKATKILSEDCRLKGTAFRLGAVLRDVLQNFLPDDVHIRSSGRVRRYLAPRPATVFRNRLCIDGGLTLFMPPTAATQTVRVCAFPASRLGLQGIGISPDCNPENRASPRELFNWALEPAEDHILDKLFELGCLDAAVWAKENPVEDVVRNDSSFVPSGIAQ